MTTWLITGCSTGLGRDLAAAVLAHGHQVVVTARDVTASDQIAEAVARAEDQFGGIDVLVNNAGYGYRAAVEEGDDTEVAQLFATNFFGAVAVTKAVLPGMRARRAGSIVNISSIGAQISPAGSGYYAASKAALEALSASLTKEVGPLGIFVTVVEPGGFRTDFAGRSLQQSGHPIADYAETAGKRRKENDSAHGTQPGDPVKLAEALIAAVESAEPPALLVLGADALTGYRSALDAQRQQLDAWAETSLSTGYTQ